MKDALNKYDMPRVSVILPCKNEERSIQSTLQQHALESAHEVIVVDGASSDLTLNIVDALAEQPTVIRSQLSNRAAQMNQGAARATGDILLFLHADTLLPANAIQEIQKLHTTGIQLGCFRRTFTPRTALLDCTSELAYWRSRLLFWSYGDQAIFIAQTTFQQLGGYREISCMEDLDLSLRAKKIAHFGLVNTPITTSARRFADAPLKRLLKDLALSLGYIFGFYRPQ